MRGDFLLALGQGAQEAFELLSGLAGLLGVLFFTLCPVLLQKLELILSGLQLLAECLFPFGMLLLQSTFLFAVLTGQFGVFLCGLLLNGQQLRGDFLLALGQGAQEAFELLSGLAGLRGQRLFTLRPVLLQVTEFFLPGLQLLAEGLFPLGVLAVQCALLFVVAACLFSLFLDGLLLDGQQLRGNFRLALLLIAQEFFQLLPTFVGLFIFCC